MSLLTIDNTGQPAAPRAPCCLPSTPGTFQTMANADAISAAVNVIDAALARAHDANLKHAVAHLTDRSVPPFGVRVNYQLTILGAVHASLLSALQEGNSERERATLEKQADRIAEAILDIGRKAGRIGKSGANGGWEVSGCHTAAGSKENKLRKAIETSDRTLAECRRAVGDDQLFIGLASAVLPRAMAAVLDERRPREAASLKQGGGAEALIDCMDASLLGDCMEDITRLLATGGAEDFRAAISDYLILPEYITPEKPEQLEKPQLPEKLEQLERPENNPWLPKRASAPGVKQGGRGAGRPVSRDIGGAGVTAVGINGDLTVKGSKVINDLGDIATQFQKMYNLGREDERRLRTLEAENASLREHFRRSGVKDASPRQDARRYPPVPEWSVETAATGSVQQIEIAGGTAVSESPMREAPDHAAGTAPRPMDEVLAQLREELDAWWANAELVLEPDEGVVETPNVRLSQLGRSVGTARRSQGGQSPADAIITELKRSFARLSPDAPPTPGQMLALQGRVARIAGPSAPREALRAAVEELRQEVPLHDAMPARLRKTQTAVASGFESRRDAFAARRENVQEGVNPDRRQLRGRAEAVAALARAREAADVQAALMNSLRNVFPSTPDSAFARPSEVRGQPLDQSAVRPLHGPFPQEAMQQFASELAQSPIVKRHVGGAERRPPSNTDLEQLLTEARSLGESIFLKLAGPRYRLTPGEREWVMERAFPVTEVLAPADAHSASSAYSLTEDDSDAVAAMAFPDSGAIDDASSADEMPTEDELDGIAERLKEILARRSQPPFVQLSDEADVEAMIWERARQLDLPQAPAAEGSTGQVRRIAEVLKTLNGFGEKDFFDYAGASLSPAEFSWVRDWMVGPVQSPEQARFEYAGSSDEQRDEEGSRTHEKAPGLGRSTQIQRGQTVQLARADAVRSWDKRASVRS